MTPRATGIYKFNQYNDILFFGKFKEKDLIMKVLLSTIDWEYPKQKYEPDPVVWDLEDRNDLFALYKSIADGIVLEMRIEGESEKALDVFRGIILGGGSGRQITLSEERKKKLWLYKEGYECYIQGRDGYFFINPIPQPEKFRK